MIEQTFNAQKFIANLTLNTWFTRIGYTTISISNNIKYANSLENALLIWNNNQNQRIQNWTKLKTKLLKNKHWDDNINIIRINIVKELNKNHKFVALNKKTNNILILQLPIEQYFGEVISGISTNFYKQEIDLYKKGYLVCEHIGPKFLIY